MAHDTSLVSRNRQNICSKPSLGRKPSLLPDRYIAEGKRDGSFRANWYSEQLRALREPTLSENAVTAGEVYRFSWLRSFHGPIAVRVIVLPNGTARLTAKMADGAGGYNPGTLIVDSIRDIGPKEVRHLRELVQAMDFWRLPVHPAPNGKVGLDGAQWILEASNHGNYHVIDRWSPDDGPLRELGLYLARTLAKLNIPPDTIY